ncbi:MAG: tRNA (adenosine(37)-N6)-threonylcarbamoyltransferase complex ATPase subunit type 1 TsaE [Ruminococcaceae bacterium]|nr:tRNA (adenosine(37)-N6)-threonylcarbamoyltransferase complex ATPase subunit type 1 TsaE [Oscillospiraceae bacterium]
MMSLETTDPEQTEALGKVLAKVLQAGDFVALYGDLGAGKTAFTRGIASHLAPNDTVSSPTYTIVNEYRSGKHPFCHFDMYRIENEDDLESIGFYDYPEDAIFVVEWCEKIPYALPRNYYRVNIEKTKGEDKRSITIQRITEEENQ